MNSKSYISETELNKKLYKQINYQLVFDLYGLTDEEIKIVEKEVG